MAERALLHKNKLDEFKEWLIYNGFEVLNNVGIWEALRWKGRTGKPMPMVYFKLNAKEHLSCNEEAKTYVRRWINERKSDQDT